MQIPQHHTVKSKDCLRERIVEPEAVSLIWMPVSHLLEKQGVFHEMSDFFFSFHMK